MTDSTAVEAAEDDAVRVTAHRCTPDRTVFTEEDNADGWVATDLTVPIER